MFLSDASAEALAAAGSASGFGAATDRVEAGLRDVGKSISDFSRGPARARGRAEPSEAAAAAAAAASGRIRKRRFGKAASGLPPARARAFLLRRLLGPRAGPRRSAAAAAAAAMALEAERAPRRSGGVAGGRARVAPRVPVAAAARRAGEAAKTLERLLEANGARPTAAAAASNSSRREGGTVLDSSSTSGVAVSDSSSLRPFGTLRRRHVGVFRARHSRVVFFVGGARVRRVRVARRGVPRRLGSRARVEPSVHRVATNLCRRVARRAAEGRAARLRVPGI